MTEAFKRILAAKLAARRALADLPFDKKLEIMEKMRERNAILAENPLRQKSHEPGPAQNGKG